MVKRDGIENEIKDIVGRLDGDPGVGEKGPLVDGEGFPRSDVDIVRIREDRSRLAMLHTDHKQITAEIESNIIRIHSEQSSNTTQERTGGKGDEADGNAVKGATQARPQYRPFALVDEVSAASPADLDGLEVGDQIVHFGSITKDTFDGNLGTLARHASSNENSEIKVEVLRKGECVAVSLTPRAWEGPGLLGCHMRLI